MSDLKLPYSHSEIGGRTFYHDTKADLKPGDMLQGGYSSNYSPWIYFSVIESAGADASVKPGA